ncbi:LAS superfamily LD-carboxypeptidase LdcB [Nocardiopsis mwathae]|uniref:LAS superfamily LD-carboxypeptidase LdcB n=1 Tax=Nocardiopsis mwathae TaxID=1472723 RepID=A0A7W9YKB8_9ACTN|nr:LAS superfamily LD-carboxypeptidase LdcB [Nocardiopsis mwathae]
MTRSETPSAVESPSLLRTPRRVRARSAQAVMFTVAVAFFVVPGADVAMAPVTAPAEADVDLDTLKEQADKAKEELEKATDDYTKREKALEKAQDELVGTLHDLQQTELKLADLREPLAELASSLYKRPDGGTLALMTSGSLDDDLETEAYVVKLSENNEALMEEANDLRAEQASLTGDAQDLQASTQLEKVELKDDLEALKKKSKESTDKLMKELEDRGLSVDAYMAGVECDPAKGAAASGYPNGLLPNDALCELYEDGHYLRADAAVDFLKMNEAYQERFGRSMCITSSYRDLSNQHRVYAEQPPGNAAVPGTSNHGWGLAIDLCGGVQNQGSEPFNWLEQNSRQWGWFHPQWAYSSPFEPWHWEYEAVSGAG